MLGIELGDRLEQTCLQHTMQNNRGKWELEAENEFGKLRKFHYWKLALIHDALGLITLFQPVFAAAAAASGSAHFLRASFEILIQSSV